MQIWLPLWVLRRLARANPWLLSNTGDVKRTLNIPVLGLRNAGGAGNHVSLREAAAATSGRARPLTKSPAGWIPMNQEPAVLWNSRSWSLTIQERLH